VALNASVTPAVPGTIQFEDNGAPIGSAVAESTGTVSTSTGALGSVLPLGSNALDAVFTPATNLAYSGSSTATETPVRSVPYTVTKIATSTQISSVSPSSPQYAGTSVTIGVTVADSDSSTPAGTVQFEYQASETGPEIDLGGPQPVASASISTASLPVGTDDLRAVFTPTSDTYASSTASAVPFTVETPPGDATTTALTVDPTSATAYTSVQLTASVSNASTTATSAGPQGTVTFYDNGSSTSNAITGSSISLETVDLGSGGTVTISYPISPAGPHNIVAVFTSSNLSNWADSTSVGVPFTSTVPAPHAAAPQDTEVDIPAGTLTITTPYSPTNPFDLGTATLNPGAGTYTASAPFGSSSQPGQGITITDTGIGENSWTASAEATNFTNGGDGGNGDAINAENLTFTQVTPAYISGNEYGTAGTNGGAIAVNTADVGNNGVVYAASTSGSEGLAGVPHTFASSSAAGTGSVHVYGRLNLVAPSSVTPGEYTATLTFTIA
jgi:hypothetical protein